jgi:hypothetical protein
MQTANSTNMIPGITLNSLLCASKLADANYTTIFTPDEVEIFNAQTTRISVKEEAVLQGWRCPQTKL